MLPIINITYLALATNTLEKLSDCLIYTANFPLIMQSLNGLHVYIRNTNPKQGKFTCL